MSHLTIAVLCAFAFGAILTNAETDCERQRRNNQGGGLLHWDIKCDAQGNYLPLQCTVETPKWCACYNDNGVVTQPSKAIRSCDCLIKKHAPAPNASPCDIPSCQRDGKYEKKQCCSTTRKCHCVDPTTGQKKTQPSSDRNLQCP